ncbi:MAG TPA: AI-2E family transporter [Sphingomonadaceae bacterium]
MATTDDEGGHAIGSSPARIADPLLAREASRALVWALVFGGAVLLAFLAKPLLIVFAGMAFGAMIDGGARLLGRVLKIGRTWRVAIVLVLAAVVLLGFFVYAGTTIAAEASQLPHVVSVQADRLAAWAASKGFSVETANLQSLAGQLASGVGTLTKALTGVIGGIATLLVIMFLGIYFSLEPRLYERGVAWMLPEKRRGEFYITTERMARQLRHLLGGRLFGMVCEGVFTWAMLSLYMVFSGAPVPMAALLGMITGLLAFIPNIGAATSGTLMILVGFSGGTQMGFYTIFVYVFVQTLDGNVLIPLIARRTVDLAPAVVLSAQLVMGVLFGILGLALADPMVAMIKVALNRRSEIHAADDRAKALGGSIIT